MKLTPAVLVILLLGGCGGDEGDTQETPQSTIISCSEVSVVSLPAALTVQEELSQEGNEIQIEITPDGDFVVVFCGGTYVDNDPETTTTTTQNDIISAEDEGDIELNTEGA